jgi:hypothetical protein
MFDPMSDLTGDAPQNSNPTPASRQHSGGGNTGDGGNQFGTEIHSITIHARQRTFYIDLKESTNGRFFKVSEKSRGGRKSTIMFDAEDLEPILGALQEMKGKLSA